MKTSTPVLAFFSEHCIDGSFKLIRFNKCKGRYCYSFIKGQTKFFLKWNDSEPEHKKYYESLKREIDTYRLLLNKGITPRFFSCFEEKASADDSNPGDNKQVFKDTLITEYLDDAVTMRTALIGKIKAEDYGELKHLISEVLILWQNYICELSNTIEDNETINSYSLFDRYLRSLLCSGPYGTKTNLVATCIHRAQYMQYCILKKRKTEELISIEKPSKCIIHGDFHLDNVLISGNQCKIIDFEYRQSGSAEIELAYLYAQIWLLLRDHADIMGWLDSYINQLNVIKKADLFKFCADVFCKAIQHNHRFY